VRCTPNRLLPEAGACATRIIHWGAWIEQEE